MMQRPPDSSSPSGLSSEPPSSDSPQQHTASSSEENHALPLLSRRNVLLLAGGSFAVMSAPRWLQQAAAQNTVQNAAAPQASPADSDFLALSALLTANQKLQPQTSARTYAALSAQTPEFQKQAAALWQFANAHQLKNVDALAAAVANNAELNTVLHKIISAWYLGVVGDGPQSKVIAFESALMFDPVRDAVVVPTYCRAAPGYWVTKPAVLKARV